MALLGHNHYKAIEDQAPDKGILRPIYYLGTFFPKFFVLNLMMLLCSLGIVTIPAVLVSANRVLLRIVRKEDFSVWSDFFTEFRNSFRKATLLGLFFALFFGAAALTLQVVQGQFQGLAQAAVLAFPGFVLLAAWIVGCYAFALMALMEQRNGLLLKNALLLALIAPGETFRIISLGVAVFLELLMFPGSLILILPGSVVLVQYLICRSVYRAMARYILPAEEGEEEEREE